METVVKSKELTTADRCDLCSAAAQVVFTFMNGELYFCGHHAKDKRSALLNQSVDVFDPLNYLNRL
jgi:hypothetical protein